jgi:hypothetical protein
MDLYGTAASRASAIVFAQAAFAYAHPQVRDNLFSNPSLALGFFAYAFVVGLLLWFVIQQRDNRDLTQRWRQFFGFGTVVGIHGTLNTVLVVWDFTVFGQAIGPLAAGPWILASSLSLSLLCSFSWWRWRAASSRSVNARTRIRSATRTAASGIPRCAASGDSTIRRRIHEKRANSTRAP